MTPELFALTLAALLQFVNFALYAIPANQELGTGFTTSARDKEPSKQLSDRTARLGRAFDNHFQSLTLFAVAVLVVHTSGQTTALTATCAWVYLAARILYIPAYVLGLRPWRSIIWVIGFGAIALMLITALF